MKAFDAGHEGPLKDVKVIDMSRLVAGNMLSLFLADFGADVIKVERPGRGDDLRHWREGGQAVYWKVYGRNKRSLALDIKSEEGLAQLKKLIKTSQVLIENFVPGGLEKMGLSPDVLHALNPALVIARVSGWGQTGPYSNKPGFGTLVEANRGGTGSRPLFVRADFLADLIRGREIPADRQAHAALWQSVCPHGASQCLCLQRRQAHRHVWLDAVHGHAHLRHDGHA
jgi:hypothetical protein